MHPLHPTVGIHSSRPPTGLPPRHSGPVSALRIRNVMGKERRVGQISQLFDQVIISAPWDKQLSSSPHFPKLVSLFARATQTELQEHIKQIRTQAEGTRLILEALERQFPDPRSTSRLLSLKQDEEIFAQALVNRMAAVNFEEFLK